MSWKLGDSQGDSVVLLAVCCGEAVSLFFRSTENLLDELICPVRPKSPKQCPRTRTSASASVLHVQFEPRVAAQLR